MPILDAPPKDLSPTAREAYAFVLATFDVEAHQLPTLLMAVEAFDSWQSARAVVAKDGRFYVNRFGEPRPHPALAVMRDAATTHARLMRDLGLGDADVPGFEDMRPPRVQGVPRAN